MSPLFPERKRVTGDRFLLSQDGWMSSWIRITGLWQLVRNLCPWLRLWSTSATGEHRPPLSRGIERTMPRFGFRIGPLHQERRPTVRFVRSHLFRSVTSTIRAIRRSGTERERALDRRAVLCWLRATKRRSTRPYIGWRGPTLHVRMALDADWLDQRLRHTPCSARRTITIT